MNWFHGYRGKINPCQQNDNGWWYYSRFEEGKQYPYYARKKETMTAAEEIILDVPKLAEPFKIFLVRGQGR